MTILVAFGALIVTYAIAIPIGVYSAVKRYSAATTPRSASVGLIRPCHRVPASPWSS